MGVHLGSLTSRTYEKNLSFANDRFFSFRDTTSRIDGGQSPESCGTFVARAKIDSPA